MLLTDAGLLRRFLEFLPEATGIESDEALVFLALFRRKWAIAAHPEKEEEIRRRFSGEQVCLGKLVLCGFEPRENWGVLVELFLKRLVYQPVYIKKEKRWVPAGEIVSEFPEGVSLTVTFEPRSLVEALKLHHQELNRALWDGLGGKDAHIEFARTLAGAWKSRVHKSRRKHGRTRFLLVDVDFPVPVRKEPEVEAGVEFLRGLGLDLRYACRTPCGGAHFVAALDKQAEEKVFRKRDEFCRKLLEAVGGDEVELKTGQCLTHVPGVHPGVEMAFFSRQTKDPALENLSRWKSLLV